MSQLADAFGEHREVVDASVALVPVLESIVDAIESCLLAGGKLLAFGNGGSAADAQHLAAELVGRYVHDRAGWPAMSLTVDTSALTAIANDYGFEQVFARQVDAHAAPGDVVVAISVSGTSADVVTAAERARRRGCVVVAFTGEGGGALADLADHLVAVPTKTVARAQEVHGLCLHAVVAELERRLPEARP